MKSYTVWAVQLLHDQQDIEAESVEDARNMADKMYYDSGASDLQLYLDPENITDGACGVVGADEWDLWTALEGVQSRRRKIAEFGAATLAILEKHEEWSSDTPDEIATVAHNLGLSTNGAVGQFTRTEEGKL